MTNLVIAEHDNASIKAATLNTIAAAQKIGGDIHVLVAGHNAQSVAQALAHIAGVTKVLVADAPYLASPTAENIAATALSLLPGGYTHVVAGATGFGKNALPRIAAKLAWNPRVSVRTCWLRAGSKTNTSMADPS